MSLKERITSGSLLVAPGAYDGLTARLIEQAGFEAVYMTGYGTAASYGLPDTGIIGRDEMVHNARRIAEAVSIPLIADADTGYGDPGEVARTVQLFEEAGAAAIHLEDQTWPKRCGHMAGKTLIEPAAMEDKIRAAVEARVSDDFLVIARTDAIAVEGFDSALERGRAYALAGADMLFIEAPETRDQLQAIPKSLPEALHLANIAPRTPACSQEDLETAGYALAIYPGLSLMAAWQATEAALVDLKGTGLQASLEDWKNRFQEMNSFLASNQEE